MSGVVPVTTAPVAALSTAMCKSSTQSMLVDGDFSTAASLAPFAPGGGDGGDADDGPAPAASGGVGSVGCEAVGDSCDSISCTP